MERSLSMELVRVTEAAALSSARWMGRGMKNEADDAATTAMRDVFNTIPMQGNSCNRRRRNGRSSNAIYWRGIRNGSRSFS